MNIDGLITNKKDKILSISIAILMFFLIISTIYLRKTENYSYIRYF